MIVGNPYMLHAWTTGDDVWKWEIGFGQETVLYRMASDEVLVEWALHEIYLHYLSDGNNYMILAKRILSHFGEELVAGIALKGLAQ